MSNNRKTYITLLIFGLMSMFLVVFFIFPLLGNIGKNSADFISAKNSIVNLAAQSSQTKDFEKNYQTYKPNFDKIDQLLIDPQNPVDFIQFLEDTATNLKITSQISLPSSALSSQPVSQNFITFRFSTKGTFPQVLSFAKAIEMGTYLVEIESLTIQNSQENTPLKNNTSKDNVQIQKTVDAAFTIEAFTKQ